ncbi:MAG: FmdB family zinc ribbon protein [Syntrophomonadaceae bacterium]|jgi:putative FmdB family regulatory protein
MPIFDFACSNCGNKFDLMISNSEKNKVKCPKCNSQDVKQLLAQFNTGGKIRPEPRGCQGCSAETKSR